MAEEVGDNEVINRLADVYRQKLIQKQGDKPIDIKTNGTNTFTQSIAKVVTIKPVREQTPPRQKYAPKLQVLADDDEPRE